LAARRDDDQAKGTQPSKIPSFSAFSAEQIISNANAIGVSMGKNMNESLKAARLIKDIETNRMLTFLNANNNSVHEDSTIIPTCLAVSRASILCDDLDGEDQYSGEDTSQNLITSRDNKRQCKKRSYDKTKVRRSERIKLKRKNLIAMEGLRGLTWNSEGIRDPGKHLFVKEAILEHRLDFIALLEVGRSNFTIPFLSNLAAGQNFAWFCLQPHGRSGGILVGVNTTTLVVNRVDSGDYCVKLSITSKIDGFQWLLVPVYGAAQDKNKYEFLAELVRTCESETIPMLLVGDFNILRKPEDKSNDNFKPHWPFIF
jgi:hypothetical protein